MPKDINNAVNSDITATDQSDRAGVPAQGIDIPSLEPTQTAKQPRNQHLKIADPKNKTLAARATQAQYDLIVNAMRANHCSDIVQLMLLSIKYHQNDLLSPFKLK